MNKIIVILCSLLLLAGISFSQPIVKTRPNIIDWAPIHSGYKLGGNYITTRDTSKEFTIRTSSGDMVLWLNTATDGLSAPNTGDLTLYIELYNRASGEWGIYPLDADGSQFVTIGASFVNVSSSSSDIYIPLGDYNEWYWADKARIIFEITSGKQLYIDAWVGGQ